MKVLLLTIWHVGNYGAEMQTYATVKALRKLGHDVLVLDYRLTESQGIKARLIESLMHFTPAYRKFNTFWSKYIPSTKHFKDAIGLRHNLPDADVYMIGSDQVWNPAITKDRCLDYFLSFVPEHKRRVAYASSIGVSEWTTDRTLTTEIATQLSKFEMISCRESDGVKVLKDIFNIDAVHVVDPTLLFADYSELIGNTGQKQTFVYYPLFGGKEMEDLCKSTASKLGLRYVNNNPQKTWLRGRIWNRLSVQEWLRNFAEAEFVATQSFHGTAFSIINNKQFFTVYNGSKVSRIANLLDALGIRDRLFPTVEAALDARPWETPINYDEVNKRLAVLRAESWDFLKRI